VLNQSLSAKSVSLTGPLEGLVTQAGEASACLRTSQSLARAVLETQSNEELQALFPCRYDPSIHTLQSNQTLLKYLHPEGVSFSVAGQFVQNQGRSQYAAIKNWSDGTSHLQLRQTSDEMGLVVWMLPKHLGLKGGGPTARVDVSDKFTIAHRQWPAGISIEYLPMDDEHLLQATVDPSNTLSFNIEASPQHRASLGSGKDMFIGLMNRLRREGISIDRVSCRWLVDGVSVNTKEFLKNLDRGMGQKDAAAKTWSGRMLAEYGFYPSSVVKEHGGAYSVMFERR
jgi:hypothetical protein